MTCLCNVDLPISETIASSVSPAPEHQFPWFVVLCGGSDTLNRQIGVCIGRPDEDCEIRACSLELFGTS